MTERAEGANEAVARALRAASAFILAVVLLWLLGSVLSFGQTRFFTVDEYQYGHATWLVAQGEVPYRDFYEHHFPLSYVLHAPLLPDSGSFSTRALTLRAIVGAYLLGLAVVLGIAGYGATRSVGAALLGAILPLGFGFGLMSAVDYRADNFGAFLFVACLGLLELNRRRAHSLLGAAAGFLFGLSLCMTQKMVVLGGGTIAVYIVLDVIAARRDPTRAKRIAAPVWFIAAAAGVPVLLLGTGLALGALPQAWEATVAHAIAHEALYPESSTSFARYALPFLNETWLSTAGFVALALAFLASGLVREREDFWLIPAAVAVVAGAVVRAPYPYNYVFACLLLGICAARGAALLVARIEARGGSLRAAAPLLLVLPLLLLPAQLGFISGRSGNASQLRLLDKIQHYGEGAAVIDGAGGAMFNPHASYYWYHGDFHRLLLEDYFSGPLIDDYRKSAALLLIDDFRLRALPARVLDFVRTHYVRGDGRLFALGFALPAPEIAGTKENRTQDIDVVRDADYRALPLSNGRPTSSEPGASGPRVDGRLLRAGEVVHLTAGRHRVVQQAGSPGYVLTPLPAAFFEEQVAGKRPYTRAFEFDRRR